MPFIFYFVWNIFTFSWFGSENGQLKPAYGLQVTKNQNMIRGKNFIGMYYYIQKMCVRTDTICTVHFLTGALLIPIKNNKQLTHERTES